MNILDYTYENFANGECKLLDAHCHMKTSDSFKLICFGLLPSGYLVDKDFASEDVQIGLGYHPWAAKTADENEILFFEKYASDAQFIGEIGLDFSEKHIGTKEKQLEIFVAICKILGNTKDKVVSIHSVHASAEVLEILKSTGADKDNTIIMHWFSGTSEELKTSLDRGYYFSVGPKMLVTRKGHEYIRQIPENKMFIETDLPWDGEEFTPEEHFNLLNDFAMQLRELKSY